MLKLCFIRPSGLYLYPSGPSPSSGASASSVVSLGAVSIVLLLIPGSLFPFSGGPGWLNPPRFPSISRYVRKLPETRLALHDLPSVHLLIPASLSSQTKTDPDLIC